MTWHGSITIKVPMRLTIYDCTTTGNMIIIKIIIKSSGAPQNEALQSSPPSPPNNQLTHLLGS
jgi:hypothetical protein